MKLLAGVYPPDSGKIALMGREMRFGSAAGALARRAFPRSFRNSRCFLI